MYKRQIFSGIEKLTQAVSSTLGASGKCVILEDTSGNPKITKDGVTVADSVILLDPVENMGARLLKEAARKTVTEAGEPKDDFMRELFGFAAKDRVDEKLGAKKYYGDMTISDINFLAQQGEYNSLLPNVTMNFADLKPYDNEVKYKFGTDLIEVMTDAVKAREDDIEAAGSSVAGGSPEKAARLKRQIQMNAAKNHIDYYAGEYYLTGFFDDEATKKMIIQSLTVPGIKGSGEELSLIHI